MYLVRHGATLHNEARPVVLQGNRVDSPLSETGRAQAKAVGECLAGLPFVAVYASGLLRARETAASLAQPHGHDVVVDDRLREVDVGDWEGVTWEQIARDESEPYRKFMQDPATHGYLNGENYTDVLARVEAAFEDLLHRHAGQVFAVVAHNVVNRVYLSRVLGLELRHARRLRQDNGGINVVRRKKQNTELVTLNSLQHLDQRQ